MDDYLSKPINPQRIAELLQAVSQRKQELAPPAAISATDDISALPGDRTGTWSPAARNLARPAAERRP